ncbi:retrovirus-related pol polyprotein from transposon TNT 1-94 [Tanacetum coccineum]
MKSVKHRIRIHGKLHYNHFTIGNSVIRWKATSQPSVALSTTESEYMALTKVAKERIWLKGLIEDLGFPQDQELQEAGGSSDGPKRRRTYIYREREEAEQRLIDDYFGDDEYEPKYPEEKFRRRFEVNWVERCDLHVRKTKELRNRKTHIDLRQDLMEHLWNNDDE